MTRKIILSIVIFIFLLPLLSESADSGVDQINLFIPAFDGPGALGRNVSTILNLQIWHTFRRKPWPQNPDNLDFGRGLIIWDIKPLKKFSHREAERIAKDDLILAQVVLWGKATPYGDGVVVQTNLTIPDYTAYRDERKEIWQLEMNNESIQVDIPRRRFEMASVVLKSSIIEKYTLPSALKIYQNRQGGEPIGVVGDSYTGIQFEPNLAKVISGSKRGWVRLPELGKNPSEVVDFVGGVIRIFRGDWKGASSSMRRVINNPSTRKILKIDAHLYLGMVMERIDQSGREAILQAYKINPYLKRTIQYLIMSDLSELKRLSIQENTNGRRSEIRARILKTMEDHRQLFAEEDPWIEQVKRMF
jgi:hypothetical protein